MHASILGVALAALGGAANAAADAAACPRTAAAVLERFIDADCASCWTDPAVSKAATDEWVLDWIVPTPKGDDAALSPAAPAEALARAQRALGKPPEPGFTTPHRTAARGSSPLHLRVRSGPAWNGYFAVQLEGSGRAPEGASAWVALVERVDAGTDGSAVPRRVVRAVAGPFEPAELRSGKPWQRLNAMRWPATAKPVRLRAQGWIEQRDGRIVAMAGERCDAR
ncbi:MAG TPA: hypothetical protein VFK10_18315 [Burkholderiaceae bacterium]|nr:hypothetical protein [Burkholderiaceae bacterium]